MVEIVIKVINAEFIRQGLENIADEVTNVGRLRIFRTLQGVLRRMKIYPPPPSGSTYKRTMILRRSWRLFPSSPQAYVIENTARHRGITYPEFVHGSGSGIGGTASGTGQAWMHVGRWRLFRVDLDEAIDKMWEDLNDDIGVLVRKSGLMWEPR